MASQVGERVKRNPLVHGQTRKVGIIGHAIGDRSTELPLRCKVREKGEDRVQASSMIRGNDWEQTEKCDPEAETSEHEQG
eukprot:2266329-Pleurochrysis_carterae.AAC.1